MGMCHGFLDRSIGSANMVGLNSTLWRVFHVLYILWLIYLFIQRTYISTLYIIYELNQKEKKTVNK